MAEILTPRCPLCNHLPAITIPGGIQAFCGNDDCVLLTWNPTKSLDDNLMAAGVARWEPTEGNGDVVP